MTDWRTTAGITTNSIITIRHRLAMARHRHRTITSRRRPTTANHGMVAGTSSGDETCRSSEDGCETWAISTISTSDPTPTAMTPTTLGVMMADTTATNTKSSHSSTTNTNTTTTTTTTLTVQEATVDMEATR